MLDAELEKLFKQVRIALGGSTRTVELKDEDLCELLDIAIGDYAQYVQNFIIENNWATLFGKKTGLQLNNNELAFAMSMRTLDLTKDYAAWFSKEVGLQQAGGNNPWELKKDFIKIEKGKQVYYVPPGREINKVMWVTPPTTDAAIWGNYGGLSTNFGNGVFAQMGMGAASIFGGMGSAYGMGAGIWALPAADIATMATDLSYKQQLLRSDLVYKVTACEDGGHLIHLMSTPGSRFTFGAGGMNTYPLYNCYVWYTYYDTSGGGADECRKRNSDVILSPDQIPLDKMEYSFFNEPTKAIIRKLLIGHAAMTLALIRGKFSGVVGMINNQLTMDYNLFMSFGKEQIDSTMTELKERLQRMTPYETMKRQAELVESMKQAQKGVPLGIYAM